MGMKYICDQSDRELWLLERLQGIGASEAAMIMGMSPWGSPLSLYTEKTGLVQRESPDNERMEWGNRLEPVIIGAFAARTQRKVSRSGKLYRSTAFPWALATFDAFCAVDGEERPLQIKTTGAEHADEWSNGPPAAYACQVQWEMLVSDASCATIACLIGGQRMVWQDVPRDDAFIERLTIAGAAFWSHVESRTPPEADGSHWTSRALGRLYPQDTGEIVQLSASLIEVADQLELAKRVMALTDKEARTAESMIKAELGNASIGVLPDGRRYSWKLQKRAAYSVDASEARVFRTLKSREDAR